MTARMDETSAYWSKLTTQIAATERTKMTLGSRLRAAGYITDAQLDLALREQKRNGRLLGEVLIELGFVSAEIVTQTLANEAQTEVVDIRKAEVPDSVLRLVSYETAKRFKLMPFNQADGMLTVVLSDAFNVVAIDHVERESGQTVNVVTAPEGHILDAIARHYTRDRSLADTIDQIMLDGTAASEDEAANESPLVRLVDQLISLGIKKGATDIHIEPAEKIVRVRMRIDGVLRQEVLIPKPIQSALTARLKLIADLNITEKRTPQDGRIRFDYGQHFVDLRVSTLPTNAGESVVLRILDRSASSLSLNDLGFTPAHKTHMEGLVGMPYGMVLVTGPTGSGKTTTLYASLKLVESEERSVFTLEDPVEYSLEAVRQTQVRPDIGMDFAAGLRALLRQDPDVILVGEIRDLETAQLATRAALTGHLVLSTLHTNDAVGVIPRLVDMGVDRYMLPAALSSIIAQRLVRVLCDHCRRPMDDPQGLIEQLELTEDVPADAELWEASGCPNCNGTGFRGRSAIYEILTIDERFHGPIITGASAGELKALAADAGMVPMLKDGIAKAVAGLTSLDEVLRVVR
ncbi:MAG: GspE/PulE family protein [Pseudomonadota bacterium]